MKKFWKWFLSILYIASLWFAIVIAAEGSFSTNNMEETLLNFVAICFSSLLFFILLLVLIKHNFFKRRKRKSG